MIGKIVSSGIMCCLGFYAGCEFGQYYNENHLRYVINPIDRELYKINFKDNKLECLIVDKDKENKLRSLF